MAESTVDEVDMKILQVLKKNSKLSYRELAKVLLMPITTLHHRIRKLEKGGVIKRYTIDVDNKKLGRTLCAYILLRVDYTVLKTKGMTQQSLAMKLKHHDDVEDVVLVTGLKDIVLKVRTANVAELNQIVTKDLRTMQGVKSTETMVVLDELDG